MKIIAAILIAVLICSRAEASTYTPLPVQTFLSQYGVNTHLQWASGYTNLATVESKIAYIGAKRVRDQVPSVASLNYYLQLYKDTGIKTTFDVNPDVTDSYANLLAFIQANRQIFNRIDGINEPDGTYPAMYMGYTGAQANSLFERQLFQDITPLCLPLSSSTVTNTSNFLAYGPEVGCQTYNIHNYLQASLCTSEYPCVSNQVATFTGLCPGKPWIMTEYGNWTTPCTTGEDYNTQAKYTLNGLFDCEMLGGQECDIYELNDQTADPSCTTTEYHYGMFDSTGTAKTSGTTMHNATTLLADSSTITPTTLSFTTSGAPALMQQMLLQKSDGTWWLALWNDASIWNPNTYTTITVSPVSVTLSLGITATTINVYDPFISTSVQQRIKYRAFSVGSCDIGEYQALK